MPPNPPRPASNARTNAADVLHRFLATERTCQRLRPSELGFLFRLTSSRVNVSMTKMYSQACGPNNNTHRVRAHQSGTTIPTNKKCWATKLLLIANALQSPGHNMPTTETYKRDTLTCSSHCSKARSNVSL